MIALRRSRCAAFTAISNCHKRHVNVSGERGRSVRVLAAPRRAALIAQARARSHKDGGVYSKRRLCARLPSTLPSLRPSWRRGRPCRTSWTHAAFEASPASAANTKSKSEPNIRRPDWSSSPIPRPRRQLAGTILLDRAGKIPRTLGEGDCIDCPHWMLANEFPSLAILLHSGLAPSSVVSPSDRIFPFCVERVCAARGRILRQPHSGSECCISFMRITSGISVGAERGDVEQSFVDIAACHPRPCTGSAQLRPCTGAAATLPSLLLTGMRPMPFRYCCSCCCFAP